MPDKSSKYLLSDADDLRRIKFAQFRRQVPALALLALAIILNSAVKSPDLGTPALVLSILAIVWYLFVGLSFRYKQRIPLPPEGALVSPIQGKVEFIRSNEELTLLSIRKIFLDSVEIRSPHLACYPEDNLLVLDTPEGRITFRFKFKHVEWFPEADYCTGNVIGMVRGAGACTITFPRRPELVAHTGNPLDAGDVLIENLAVIPRISGDEPEPVPEQPESGDASEQQPEGGA